MFSDCQQIVKKVCFVVFCAQVLQQFSTMFDGAIGSKIRKIVPYGANPNTRNGARLRSPSLIMTPVPVQYREYENGLDFFELAYRLVSSV